MNKIILTFLLFIGSHMVLKAQQLRLATNYEGGINYIHTFYYDEEYKIGQQHALGIQLQYQPFSKRGLHLQTGINLTTTLMRFREYEFLPSTQIDETTIALSPAILLPQQHRFTHHLSIPLYIIAKNRHQRGIYGGFDFNVFLFASKAKAGLPENFESTWDAPRPIYINTVLGYQFDIKNKFHLSVEGFFNLTEFANENQKEFGAERLSGRNLSIPYRSLGLNIGFGYYFWQK